MEPTDSLASIEAFLKSFERNHQILIIYACDIGSRSLGLDVPASDYDLKGFFFLTPVQSLALDSIPKRLKKSQQAFIFNGNEIEIDYEFINVRTYFKALFLGKLPEQNYWMFSPIVYRQLYPEFGKAVRRLIGFPIHAAKGKLFNTIHLATKKKLAKKRLLIIAFSLQIFHYILGLEIGDHFLSVFEEFDVLEKAVKENKEEYKEIAELREACRRYYEMKKKERWAEIEENEGVVEKFSGKIAEEVKKGNFKKEVAAQKEEVKALYGKIMNYFIPFVNNSSCF